MPRVKSHPKKWNKRRGARRMAMGRRVGLGKRMYLRRAAPRYTINTASVKECYTVPVIDGNVVFFRQVALFDLIYDRAQTVAAAYQQFRVKYVKLTFRPSADTYQPIPGNAIPQLYYMIDKANAIPLGADANTFFSMGARPHRFDDKNLIVAFKPTALAADITNPGVVVASQLKTSPWLSTNANSGNPAAGWAPSQVEHGGIVFYVSKINPADNITYFVDVEVVFEFRKPVWKGAAADTIPATNVTIKDGEVKPLNNAL